jgi:mannose-6-phosphate isomerase-like protein (cupin superfamily)
MMTLDAKHWRERAEEARAVAGSVKDAVARETMLKIAEDYDKLAKRAEVRERAEAMPETGWHYHTCDMQFVYILRGWVDLEFTGGRKARFGAVDSVLIPGGLPHQETATSDDLELIEVSVPAEIGTEACDPA